VWRVAAAAVLVAGETELSMVEAKLAVDMHGVSNMSLNFWPLPKWGKIIIDHCFFRSQF
jgi:hypothetical protein